MYTQCSIEQHVGKNRLFIKSGTETYAKSSLTLKAETLSVTLPLYITAPPTKKINLSFTEQMPRHEIFIPYSTSFEHFNPNLLLVLR